MPAKWKYGFICDGAMQVQGKWTYQGVFTKIHSFGLPAMHPQLSVGFSFNAAVGAHTLKIVLVGSEGKPVAPELRMTVECREFEDTEIIFGVGPLLLPAEGFYSFRVHLDDEPKPIGEIEFQVLLAKAPGASKEAPHDDR
jgi:hypothetical protein